MFKESYYDSISYDEIPGDFGMLPKKLKLRDHELFRVQLVNMVVMDHPLIKLAVTIDWFSLR